MNVSCLSKRVVVKVPCFQDTLGYLCTNDLIKTHSQQINVDAEKLRRHSNIVALPIYGDVPESYAVRTTMSVIGGVTAGNRSCTWDCLIMVVIVGHVDTDSWSISGVSSFSSWNTNVF